MNTDYRYQLETRKLTGRRQQKTTCPSCGRKKCFVRYVDTKNGFQYIADEVGKCDHEHSCGYHYKPSDFFKEHPDASPQNNNFQSSIILPRLHSRLGARFTLFPDSGCFEKWQKVMHQTDLLSYSISPHLETYPPNTDLADLLLQPP